MGSDNIPALECWESDNRVLLREDCGGWRAGPGLAPARAGGSLDGGRGWRVWVLGPLALDGTALVMETNLPLSPPRTAPQATHALGVDSTLATVSCVNAMATRTCATQRLGPARYDASRARAGVSSAGPG